MLVGARLAGRWHHTRAPVLAAARWSPDALGLLLVGLIATRVLDRQAPLHLVVDDTLVRRSDRKVWVPAGTMTRWHAGASRSPWGKSWVVLRVLVRLPFLPQRAVCLPVLARLWRPHQPGRSKLDLPARWSHWSPSATPTAASTRSATPPTPDGRCGSCPPA